MAKWWGRLALLPFNPCPGVFARLRRSSSGNVLAMTGAAMVPIAGMIGSGLDLSRAYMAHAKMQNACDAAALAARRTMAGSQWSTAAQQDGERFFAFNFPSSTMNASDVSVTVAQNATDASTVDVTASASIPTSVMSLFGRDTIAISVSCSADEDYGNNDIMVVLDVTGSMNCQPGVSGSCGNSERTGSKASRLRDSAGALYRALEGAENTRTRYGIMPYSMTVNVGGDLRNDDIRRVHYYSRDTSTTRVRHVDSMGLPGSNTTQRIQNWRASSRACIDERSNVGMSGSVVGSGSDTTTRVVLNTAVSQDDIDRTASGSNDRDLQWGIFAPSSSDISYDQSTYSGECPARASRLRAYATESEFNTAIAAATADLRGNTYHDIGMVWAARYLSSTGMFAADNPTMWNNVPVAKHIVFLTDGELSVNGNNYSAYGVWSFSGDRRLTGSGSQNSRHQAHFLAACNRAKSMGMTVWVIALDVTAVDAIAPCATSSGHFFASDGSDLESVFSRIGAGIGRLRLTQ